MAAAHDQGGRRVGVLGDPAHFGRSVLSNIIANLVAAAIIYLVGAAAGLLPREAVALFIAVAVICVGWAIPFWLMINGSGVAEKVFFGFGVLFFSGVAWTGFALSDSIPAKLFVGGIGTLFAIGNIIAIWPDTRKRR